MVVSVLLCLVFHILFCNAILEIYPSYCLFSAVLSTKLEKKPLLFPNYFLSISFFFFFQCLFLTVCARLFVVCSSLSLLLFSIESTRLLFYKQEKQKKTEVDLLFLTYNSSEVYFEINHCMSIFHLE